MAEQVYPSLQKEGERGPIGFEGVAQGGQEGDKEGSFSVQFTPSAKQQLTEDQPPTYRTFDGGEQPIQASSEEINLLEKQDSPSEKEKVKEQRWCKRLD